MDFMAYLKEDPTDWLLEEDNPSVRYFALRDLLGLPEQDERVHKAKQAIMQSGLVPEILALQRQPEYTKVFPQFYTNKYKGLVWSLIVLAELGASINEQIQQQCEYILNNAQEKDDGGFAMHLAAKTGGGRKSEVIPCLSGNMVFTLIHFGYLNDPRLQKGIDYLVRFMRFNDGMEEDPQVAPYDHYETCWGKHTCHMGVVKALKAMNAIPKAQRTPECEELIQKAAEFLLIHHIHRQSHNLKKTSKPGWLKFGFPLMYQTDILEILDILTALEIRDPRMGEAIQVVIGKQDESGRWHTENAYNSERLLVPMEPLGEQSKWLTLRAMRALKRY